MELETISFFHPDALALYFEGRLSGLNVRTVPPSFSNLLNVALSRFCSLIFEVQNNVEKWPSVHFSSQHGRTVFESLIDENSSQSILARNIIGSKLRLYILDSINEGKLKEFYRSSIFNTCGVGKSLFHEQFFSPGEKILNHGQISNEFSYKSMTQQFMQDCLEDLKTLDRLVPNAEIGQYLNGAVPGRADCNLASILFLLNLEEDTRIAKELKSSENLMSYLIRFESLVHRKKSDPKLLELRIGSKPSNTQKYIAIGLTLCFLGVMFDLPKKIGRKLAKS